MYDIIIFVLSIYFLWPLNKYTAIYILGYIISTIVNAVLKAILREPSPQQNKTFIKILETNGKNVEITSYGMPSMTAQNSAYSFAYSFLVLTNNMEYISKFQNIFWIFITIIVGGFGYSIIKNKNTIAQIIVGLLVGILIGFVVYRVGKNKITLTEKKNETNFL